MVWGAEQNPLMMGGGDGGGGGRPGVTGGMQAPPRVIQINSKLWKPDPTHVWSLAGALLLDSFQAEGDLAF